MFKRWIPVLAVLPFAAFSPATPAEETTTTEGDVIVVEEVIPGQETRPVQPQRDMPTRGMDMANVRNVFGEPREMHPAVGEPPITRWDYDGYAVFFEHDKVLHSVITE